MPKYYTNGWDEYIQIHDEHILRNAREDLDEEEYVMVVRDVLNDYEKDLGCAVFLLGRSGRHCCIHPSEYRKYKKAVRLWKEKYKPRILSFIS